MATTIAQTAIDTCKSQGYNVSVHVVGREGQVILGVRSDGAGLATFENSMKKAYTAAGIDPITFHELRHTYASMLINRGVSLKVVAEQLGHVDTRMVEKHYGHLCRTATRNTIRRKSAVLNLGKKMPRDLTGAGV